MPTALLVVMSLAAAPVYPWLDAPAVRVLHSTIATPEGAVRVPVEPGSYADFLRHLPVAPAGTPVVSFRGDVVDDSPAAVIALDVGNRDLQQCADSIIRLYAEYQFGNGPAGSATGQDAIAFRYTSGDISRWSAYRSGRRAVVRGSKVTFPRTAAPDASHPSFRRYLDSVFVYAGTASLARYSDRPKQGTAVRAGDFFVKGGRPGHAILVLDVARDAQGRTYLLIGQGYMPAQSFHVIKAAASVWHRYDGEVRVSTWPAPFVDADRRRIPR